MPPLVETGTGVPPDQKFFLARLIEWLKHILHVKAQKKFEEELKEASEHEHEFMEKEKRADRERSRRNREAQEDSKAYNERRSAEETAESIESARQVAIEKIKRDFREFINDRGREGSGYLYNEIVRDATIQEGIERAIEENPGVAYLIDELVTRGRELHGDAAALINITRNLVYEGRGRGEVLPLVNALKERIVELLPDTIALHDKDAKRPHGGPNFDEWVSGSLEFDVTKQQLTNLRNEHNNAGVREEAVNNLIDSVLTSAPRPDADTSWTNVQDQAWVGDGKPAKGFAQEMDKIWKEVERSEATGSHLTAERLQEISQQVREAESKWMPDDVRPGTAAFDALVKANHLLAKDRLDRLTVQFKERLRAEKPKVTTDITSAKEFLKVMPQHRGRLADLLLGSPKMHNLFIGTTEESRHFRDLVFLRIHGHVLKDNYRSSRDNFGLYENADFSDFLDILTAGMAKLKRPETNISYGKTWSDWYINLSNTIQSSRDIDFWAAQPDSNMEMMAKSLSMFANAASVQALTIPAVETAFRAYEDTLLSIRDSNNGYLPPQLFQYDGANMTSYWDEQSYLMVRRMIKAGVIPDVARDEAGFHKVHRDGNTVMTGEKLSVETLDKEDPENLQLWMHMMLGKGFGLASLRYLEIIANSKTTGSKQIELGLGKSFHSGPYEGPARALNYFSTMVHKWSFGNEIYLHMMNQLLPDGEKIRHIDEKEAMKVYLASKDGTLKEKYGEKAKRLLDLLNFSGFSSAFGPPWTQWRHFDSTINWSDRKRELLGGPTLVMLSRRMASERVKEFLVVGKYKKEFIDALRQAGKEVSGYELDRLWQQAQELPKYKSRIEGDWDKMGHHKEVKDLIDKYQKAFIARVWVQTAMRNPFIVAHNMEFEVPDEVLGGKKKMKLHKYIVQKVLGIFPEDIEYGQISDKAAFASTPTIEQKKYMQEVMGLEADLAAVREQAVEWVNGEMKYRELRDSDFEVIKSEKNKQQAKEYWRIVKQVMMGDSDPEELYERLGLKVHENREDYEVDWDKIRRIDKILDEEIGVKGSGFAEINSGRVMLNKKWAEKEWEYIFGTDDTAYRQMNLSNLGPRQWARRGGDGVAHEIGGKRVGQYLMHDVTTNPNPEDLAKALIEIVKSYEGDMIEAGWQVASILGYGTCKLYELDYKRLGSVMQLEIMKTRRGGAAWNANARRRFLDTLEHARALPFTHEGTYDVQSVYTFPNDIHSLKKLLRAENKDVWTEILLMGAALAVAITLWKAITAPSEEEEGGGCGGGHH